MPSSTSLQATPDEMQVFRPAVVGWAMLYAVNTGRSGAVQPLITAFQQEWNAALPAFRRIASRPPATPRTLSVDGAYGRQTATALYLATWASWPDTPLFFIPFSWNAQVLSEGFERVAQVYPQVSDAQVGYLLWRAIAAMRSAPDTATGNAVRTYLNRDTTQQAAPSGAQVTSQTTVPGKTTMSQYATKLSQGAPKVGPDTGVVNFEDGETTEYSFGDERVVGQRQRESINWAPWLIGAAAISAAGLIYARNR